jgi:hypothetical protein
MFQAGLNRTLPLVRSPLNVDLGEEGCGGLWIGDAVGMPSNLGLTDLIIGKAQTFEIYRLTPHSDPTLPPTLSLRYRSVGLGSNVGAFNAIVVHKGVDAGNGQVRDYIVIGTDGYVFVFATDPYTP